MPHQCSTMFNTPYWLRHILVGSLKEIKRKSVLDLQKQYVIYFCAVEQNIMLCVLWMCNSVKANLVRSLMEGNSDVGDLRVVCKILNLKLKKKNYQISKNVTCGCNVQLGLASCCFPLGRLLFLFALNIQCTNCMLAVS